MTKPNLAIFDFCETLVNFQTAFPFIEEVLIAHNPKGLKRYRMVSKILSTFKLYSVANKFLPKLNLSKRIQLYFMKGIEKSKIDEIAHQYYTQRIVPNFNKNVLDKLQEHQKEGDFIFISSGGYQPYLEIFCKEFNIPTLFCSSIEYKKQKATGYMIGKDCMFQHKVTYLETWLHANPIQYNESYCYSDSSTDLPLLKWVNHGVVISSKKPQQWASTHQLKEWLIQN